MAAMTPAPLLLLAACDAKRANRRARTARIVARRNRQWRTLMGCDPRKPGRARNLSHLDCGKPGCKCGGRVPRPLPDAGVDFEEAAT